MTFRIRALLVMLILVTTSRAGDYVVVTNSDSGPGSLRQAILDANTAGGGTITFSNVTGTIALQSGLPVLTANITISGPGTTELLIYNDTWNVLTNSTGSDSILIGLAISGTVENLGTMAAVESRFGGRHTTPGLRNSGSITLTRCAISGRNFDGSAMENYGTVSMDHCAITNNQGSADVYNSGTLTADNSVFSGHSFFTSSSGAILNDGGIIVLRNCSITNNDSVEGGGIWNGGSVAVTNCTISGNFSGYSDAESVGGGVYNIGYAVMQNTTISGNTAQATGGGIWNRGSLRLVNCTVVSNRLSGNGFGQPVRGAGIWNFAGAIFQSRNSIFAANTSRNTNCSSCPDDISGYFESFGHNLILSTNGWTSYNKTDLVGVDPMLGPLQDNGGPTLTHALLQGSPAIDAGDPNGAPADDQRGVPRPQGPGVDIGAFEYEYPTSPFFTDIEFQSVTNVILKAFALPSTRYTLQASQDLVSWDEIATLAGTSNGVLQVTNLIAGPKRFFRLRSPSP